jgi:ssDNA-binding replication factor A large subunit
MTTENRDVDIAELEPGMGDINVTFKVVEKGETNEVTSRRDDSTHYVSDTVVGDTTGTVVIPVWDDTIDKLETGTTYELKNAHTGLFQGNLRLKFNQESELVDIDEEIEDVNLDNNVSEAVHNRRRETRW